MLYLTPSINPLRVCNWGIEHGRLISDTCFARCDNRCRWGRNSLEISEITGGVNDRRWRRGATLEPLVLMHTTRIIHGSCVNPFMVVILLTSALNLLVITWLRAYGFQSRSPSLTGCLRNQTHILFNQQRVKDICVYAIILRLQRENYALFYWQLTSHDSLWFPDELRQSASACSQVCT
jgi:hypothetical protein